MWPISVALGPVTVSIFGIFLSASFLLASFFLFRASKDDLELTPELVFDAVLVTTFGAILGARIWYIIFHPQEFTSSYLLYILFRERPGMAYAGGVIGGLMALFCFTKLRQISIWKIFAVSIPAYLWVYLLAQLGSMLDGFSYGVSTQLPWGVSIFGSRERFHPLPLYQIVFSIILLFWLRYLGTSGKVRRWPEGSLFLLMFGFLNIFSGIIDIWRSASLINQIISLTIGIAAFIMVYLRGRVIRHDLKLVLAFTATIGQNMGRKLKKILPKKRYEVS